MTDENKTGCAAIFFNLFGTSSKVVTPLEKTIKVVTPLEETIDETVLTFPYRLRDDFLSPAEFNFYHVLHQAVGHTAIICLKVSLGDLFYPKTGNRSDNQVYRNKIDRKHVDFLLCDPTSMRPLIGIELDDSSHQQRNRQDRDSFVEQVFFAAELPLLRQPVRAAYNTQDLVAKLTKLTNLDFISQRQLPTRTTQTPKITTVAAQKTTAFEHSTPVISMTNGDVPNCPKCGNPMALRTVKKAGPQYGNQFWGCPDFPRCRGVRQFL